MYEYAGAGEEGFFPTVVPIACPVGMFWDEHARRCAPIVMSPPPPIVPILAGYYAGAPVGEWHDIEPNLFGVDAALKGCGLGMYWDGYFKRCAKVSVPLGPAPAPVTSRLDSHRATAGEDDYLFGADALAKGCSPGTYWNGWYHKCEPPFPQTLEEWSRLH